MNELTDKYMIYDERYKAQYIKEIIELYGFDYVMGLFVSHDFSYRVGDYDDYKGMLQWYKKPCFSTSDTTMNFKLVDLASRGEGKKNIFVFSIIETNNMLVIGNELDDDGEFLTRLYGSFDNKYMREVVVANICNILRPYEKFDNVIVKACKLYSYESMVQSLIEAKRDKNRRSGVNMGHLG
ncbi:MAG: hypothetical protein RR840_06405 [Clostridium sp.]